MASIISCYQGETLDGKDEAFVTLARAIVGQQISVKAADAVWSRFAVLMSDITPGDVLAIEETKLREAGLSHQKISYIRDLARFFLEEAAAITVWSEMDDERVITHLTTIKGIGRWTAEMFLLFHLLRPNVFPIDDIGLQKAIEKHYLEGKALPKKRKDLAIELQPFSELWHPFCSVATWYLWRSLDPAVVAY